MISLIFLLGAGASVEAGMPLVAQLTTELRDQLPYIRDINGERRTEFLDLFNALAEYEAGIRSNYERFFEWLHFLVQGQSGSFRKAVTFNLDQRLVDAAPFLILEHQAARIGNSTLPTPVCHIPARLFRSERKSPQSVYDQLRSLCRRCVSFQLHRCRYWIPSEHRTLEPITISKRRARNQPLQVARISELGPQ
jgi:hypothetical protein